MLAICCGAAAPEPVTVDVTMIDYKFVPDHLTFQHGVHYRLHLENHGKETHEFTAPIFFASAKIDNPDVLNREHTEIVMQPGDAKDVFLTPEKPGSLRSALRRPRLVWHGGRHHRPIAGAKACGARRRAAKPPSSQAGCRKMCPRQAHRPIRSGRPSVPATDTPRADKAGAARRTRNFRRQRVARRRPCAEMSCARQSTAPILLDIRCRGGCGAD